MEHSNLLRLRIDALRGDERAQTVLLKELVSTMTRMRLFDRQRLNTHEDFEALKLEGSWRAVQTYDERRGLTLDMWARICVKREIGAEMKRLSRDHIPMVSLDEPNRETLIDALYSQEAFALHLGMDPRLVLIRKHFEKLLAKQAPLVLKVYELKAERPWLTMQELGEILDVSKSLVIIHMRTVRSCLAQALAMVNGTLRQFELVPVQL